VRQLNFIIGIQGTIVEHRWRCIFATLGIERRREEKITRRCMTASIENAASAKISGNGQRRVEGVGRGGLK
jgi:hypothetical protein